MTSGWPWDTRRFRQRSCKMLHNTPKQPHRSASKRPSTLNTTPRPSVNYSVHNYKTRNSRRLIPPETQKTQWGSPESALEQSQFGRLQTRPRPCPTRMHPGANGDVAVSGSSSVWLRRVPGRWFSAAQRVAHYVLPSATCRFGNGFDHVLLPPSSCALSTQSMTPRIWKLLLQLASVFEFGSAHVRMIEAMPTHPKHWWARHLPPSQCTAASWWAASPQLSLRRPWGHGRVGRVRRESQPSAGTRLVYSLDWPCKAQPKELKQQLCELKCLDACPHGCLDAWCPGEAALLPWRLAALAAPLQRVEIACGRLLASQPAAASPWFSPGLGFHGGLDRWLRSRPRWLFSPAQPPLPYNPNVL